MWFHTGCSDVNVFRVTLSLRPVPIVVDCTRMETGRTLQSDKGYDGKRTYTVE